MTTLNPSDPPAQIPFTADAFAKLKQEKQRLTALRAEVMARLKEAREQGDLSENGAYHYAKFELGHIHRQLRTLNYQLTNGFVPTPLASHRRSTSIQFGSMITLQNLNTQTTLTFMLVSEYEADPNQNKLSMLSPIGASVFGKQKGSQVTVKLPKGEQIYQIVEVK
jgi:transcription elongation factor GreA